MRLRDHAWTPIAALSAAWLCAALLVGVHGDFPLNDDFAYAHASRALLDTGHVQRLTWTWAPVYTNAAIGAVAEGLFGRSFAVLRCSTLAFGLLGVLITYALTRDLGGSRRTAALAAACLGFNPIYLDLCFTFMTDVAFTAIGATSLWALCRALDRRSWTWAALGLAAAIAATLSRQVGLAIPVGLALTVVVLSWHRRWVWTSGLVLAAAAVAGFVVFSARAGQSDGGSMMGFEMFERALASVRSGRHHVYVQVLLTTIVYLGWFLAPVTVGARPPRSSWWLSVALMGITAFGVVRVLGHPFPPGYNIIGVAGIGPLTGYDPVAETLTLPLQIAIWFPLVLLGAWWAGGAVAVLWRDCAPRLAAAAARSASISGDGPRALIVATATTYLGVLLATHNMFDRYLLFVLPGLLALIGARASWTDARRRVAVGMTAVVIVLSVAGARDYMEYHRARDEVTQRLLERGATAAEIDGEFEFNMLHDYEGHYRDGRYVRPSTSRHPPRYAVGAEESLPGYERIDSVEFVRLLPPGRHRYNAFERRDD